MSHVVLGCVAAVGCGSWGCGSCVSQSLLFTFFHDIFFFYYITRAVQDTDEKTFPTWVPPPTPTPFFKTQGEGGGRGGGGLRKSGEIEILGTNGLVEGWGLAGEFTGIFNLFLWEKDISHWVISLFSIIMIIIQ